MGNYKKDFIDMDSIYVLADSRYQVKGNNELEADYPIINGNLCKRILLFLNRLSKLKKAPPLECDSRNKLGIYPLTKEGKELKELAALTGELTEARKYYKLHPKIELFERFVVKKDVCGMIQNKRELLLFSWTAFHSTLTSEKTIISVLNFTKGPEKNYRSMGSYINSLFGLYARLLVIRVDLSYKTEDSNGISLEEVIRHRRMLLSNARKDSLAKSWVGYAWRLEYAPKTGYHYHLVVFLDGSKYWSDYMHSEAIRQEWEKITQNKGRVYLCNLNTKQYRFQGIGMVDYHDEIKRGYLRKALAYLTKADKLAKLSLKNNRTFGRGCLKRDKTNRGRKRSKPDRFWDDIMKNNRGGSL